MKRIQGQELMKSIKYHYHVLTIKDTYQMMEIILWLIFIKILKIKGVMTTEKDYDNRKML